jgi:hypothetical protein
MHTCCAGGLDIGSLRTGPVFIVPDGHEDLMLLQRAGTAPISIDA